ncbi:imidazole glycerol phosphate synthase subunit HisH [Deferribacterales bacterium RsTz2092]|nr:imidazole glycerol phosphate synthase subunit HisH [Deferribacterales bacterium]
MNISKNVVLIDDGGANFTSVTAGLEQLGVNAPITRDARQIQAADLVILPGVGAAGYSMKHLRDNGLVDVICGLKQPVLGICLGQQLLCESSSEDNAKCLGIIPVKVKKLENIRIIPHMGWNNLTEIADDPLLEGFSTEDNFYFVHSFAPEVDSRWTIGVCDYGVKFSAIIRKDNFYGVQFHPEKSGKVGARLLANFLRLKC